MNGKLKCKVAAVNEVSQLCNGKVSERVFIEYKGTLSKEIPKLIYFKPISRSFLRRIFISK